jgi:hypothetical protein
MNLVKRGQSANSAAVVIILIAVMIILYILFLPPEDRAALLGEDNSGNNGNGGSSSARTNILMKSPGRIYPSGSNMVEHKLPSFMVFTTTNANELKRVDSMYVKNSPFNMQKGELIFYYDETTTESPKLSFNVVKQTGLLKITLNDKKVYEGTLSEGSPPPLSLPSENLKNRNTLTFEVSSPGVLFWRVNEYELESIVVSGKVTDYSAAMSEQHFSISDNEYEKSEKALFEFLLDCPPKENGQVQLILNGRPIYTSFPDCGIKASIELSKELLRPGDNILVATTTEGSFLMDSPKVTTFMRETPQPVFYFTVPMNLMEAVYAGGRGILLSLRFADSTTLKRGVIEVNGFKTGFDTQDTIYQIPLDPDSLLEGSNGIKIVPVAGPIDVVALRVDVI